MSAEQDPWGEEDPWQDIDDPSPDTDEGAEAPHDEEAPLQDVDWGLLEVPSQDLRNWVAGIIGKVESRPWKDSRWCERWDEHPEAIARFDALQQAYIAHAIKNVLSAWWTNHFDRHAPLIFGQQGIFERCYGPDGHQPVRAFPFVEDANESPTHDREVSS